MCCGYGAMLHSRQKFFGPSFGIVWIRPYFLFYSSNLCYHDFTIRVLFVLLLPTYCFTVPICVIMTSPFASFCLITTYFLFYSSILCYHDFTIRVLLSYYYLLLVLQFQSQCVIMTSPFASFCLITTYLLFFFLVQYESNVLANGGNLYR